MLGTYYYHEIIRKTIIAFGTLFNQIDIKHKDGSGNINSVVSVPLAYGPSQKFLARLEQQANLDKPVQITLPFCKLNDDALQIVEQILPYFQPSFNLTIDLVDSIGEKRDIPVVLNSVGMQDDYEGDFSTRRALIYTLQFTAKTYLFGPVADNPEGLIRKVIVDMYSDTNTQTAKREVRYTAVPDPINADPGDDFGFTETWEYFGDSKSYSPTQQTDI